MDTYRRATDSSTVLNAPKKFTGALLPLLYDGCDDIVRQAISSCIQEKTYPDCEDHPSFESARYEHHNKVHDHGDP